jgi:amino acid permease
MGAGILSLPVTFRYLGMILGTLFIALIALANHYSVRLLLQCKDMTNKNGYAMFSKITYGAAGNLILKIIIIINNFGMCCAYFRIFGETAHNLASLFVEKNSFFYDNWNNYFYVLIIFLIMSFLIFKDNLDSLKSVSFLGVAGITIFFISLIIILFYKISQNLIPDFNSSCLWPSGEYLDIMGSLPTVFLAFTFQFNVFPIYFSLKNRTKQEMMKASTVAISFCFFIYSLTGFIGYYMYRNTLKDTILQALTIDVQEFKGKDSFMIVILVIVNIAFLFSSTMSIPLMFFSLKNNLSIQLFFVKKNLVDKLNLLETKNY